jgi:hypothetical protein
MRQRVSCWLVTIVVVLAGASRADIQNPDLIPPPTPANLHLNGATSNSITMCWDAVVDTGGSGLDGYMLLRDGYKASRGSNTCQTDARWPKADTAYGYRVFAYDNAGNKSGNSGLVNAQTLAQAPVAPQYDVTVVLVKFSDYPAEPFNIDYAEEVVFYGADSVNSWFQTISYGQSQVVGSVHGWYVLPKTGAQYCSLFQIGLWYGCDTNEIEQDILALLPPHVPVAADDATIYVINGMGSWGFSGIFVSADFGFKNFVMTHELLHNFWNMGHAGTMDCGGDHAGPNLLTPLGSSCSLNQYGDPHDPMGSWYHHTSAHHKIRMGVLDQSASQLVTEDGVYQIGALEVAGSGVKQLEIPIQNVGSYIVEYRKPIDFDAVLPDIDGVLVRWALAYPGAAYIDTLIPRVYDGNPFFRVLVVNPGIDFHDTYRDIRISVIQKIGDTAYVEVDLPDAVTIAARVPGLVGGGAAGLGGLLLLLGAWRLRGRRRRLVSR